MKNEQRIDKFIQKMSDLIEDMKYHRRQGYPWRDIEDTTNSIKNAVASFNPRDGEDES